MWDGWRGTEAEGVGGKSRQKRAVILLHDVFVRGSCSATANAF
jgi:hypothetical protein